MYAAEVDIGGQKVAIRELTVKDFRAWLMDIETQAKDMEAPLFSIDRDLFPDISLNELPRFTDLDAEKIDCLTPSQLREVVDQVKKVNPSFFDMRGRMDANAKAVLNFFKKSALDLNAPPASLSSTGTTAPGTTH